MTRLYVSRYQSRENCQIFACQTKDTTIKFDNLLICEYNFSQINVNIICIVTILAVNILAIVAESTSNSEWQTYLNLCTYLQTYTSKSLFILSQNFIYGHNTINEKAVIEICIYFENFTK